MYNFHTALNRINTGRVRVTADSLMTLSNEKTSLFVVMKKNLLLASEIMLDTTIHMRGPVMLELMEDLLQRNVEGSSYEEIIAKAEKFVEILFAELFAIELQGSFAYHEFRLRDWILQGGSLYISAAKSMRERRLVAPSFHVDAVNWMREGTYLLKIYVDEFHA